MTGAGRNALVGPGLLLVLVTAVVSGVSTYVNAFAVRGTSSDAFVTVRNLAVAAFLVPLFLAATPARRSLGPLRRHDLGLLAGVGLVGGAVPFLLFFHGLQLAAIDHGTTTASFLYRTLFLVAAVFAWVFLRERVDLRYVVGAVLLLAGSYLLLSLTSPVWTDGSLYVLAATVLWAGEYTLSKRLLARVPATTVALGRMGFGAVFLSAYLAVTLQWSAVGAFSPALWTWVGISAALLTVFVVTWYAGLARVELGVAASVLVIGYPVTWLLSVLAGTQGLTVVDAAAVAAVIAGAGTVVGLARARALWTWLSQGWAPDRPTA